MVKVLLIIILVALLMEDSSSIKKSEEEKREEKELAELVNRTLAEEEKKCQEEKEKKEDGKKTGGQEDGNERGTVEKKEGQDEACPPVNYTCPSVKPCPTDKECPSCEDCEPCVDCQPCEDCKPCKGCKPCKDCKPCKECGLCPEVKPCVPCPVANYSGRHQDDLSPPSCPEPSNMSVPVAMAIGAAATLLAAGVATAIGLLLRYVSPIVCGFIFMATIIIVWYLSSQHPETARELGGRVVATLREATIALSHRVMEAIRHHVQVSFSNPNPLTFEFHI
jgi:hypothetical protein